MSEQKSALSVRGGVDTK
ncbi:Protein of unknown function [Bacillus wiedmannii]|nr:Protein of unknown function [Bacillus wiedmannii]